MAGLQVLGSTPVYLKRNGRTTNVRSAAEIGIIFIMTKIAMVHAVHSITSIEADGCLTLMRQTVGKIPIWMAMEVAVCQLTQIDHNIAVVPFLIPSVHRW